MMKKKPKAPKAKVLSIRSLIASIDDRVKSALVDVLVRLAKTDVRAAELYARYSGEGGMMTSPEIPECHFTLNIGAATARDADYFEGQFDDAPEESTPYSGDYR